MQQAIMQYSQPLIAASTTSIKRGHKPRAADGVRRPEPGAVRRICAAADMVPAVPAMVLEEMCDCLI